MAPELNSTESSLEQGQAGLTQHVAEYTVTLYNGTQQYYVTCRYLHLSDSLFQLRHGVPIQTDD